jgi:hypothetical protein
MIYGNKQKPTEPAEKDAPAPRHDGTPSQPGADRHRRATGVNLDRFGKAQTGIAPPTGVARGAR